VLFVIFILFVYLFYLIYFYCYFKMVLFHFENFDTLHIDDNHNIVLKLSDIIEKHFNYVGGKKVHYKKKIE